VATTLPDAFATRVADHIRYGAQAVRIEQGEHTARVTYVQAGSPHSADAGRVICAVPLPLLRLITVPALSEDKRRAIREIPYLNCTKVFLQMQRPFWTAQGLSGFAVTDLPVQEVWSLGHGQRSSRGILPALSLALV
jgi:monoamine oxidase